MRAFILFSSISILIFPLFSSGEAVYSTKAMRSRLPTNRALRVDQAVNRCLQRSYKCEFTSKPYPNLKSVQSTLSTAIRPFLAIGGAIDTAQLSGPSMQAYLNRRFQDETAARTYSECQQVCFSGCLTADLIKYDDGLVAIVKAGNRPNPLFDSVERKLRAGKGVCTDFSRTANSLLSQLEAAHKVLIVNEGSHAVVQVDFNNKSYIYEPQASACKFFQIPN